MPVTANLFGMGPAFLWLAQYSEDRIYAQYADLYAKFSTGPLAHNLIAAFDYSRLRSDFVIGQAFGIGFSPLLTPDRSAPRDELVQQQTGIIVHARRSRRFNRT